MLMYWTVFARGSLRQMLTRKKVAFMLVYYFYLKATVFYGQTVMSGGVV